MPCDQGGIKTCDKVQEKERNKYKLEEEVAQNKFKKSRVEFEASHEMFGSGLARSGDRHPPIVVDSRLCKEHYQISLTKIAGMMWIKKFTGFSMHVVCHSMFFAHPIGMKWYKPSMVPLKDIGALGMTKLEPWDLIGKEPKSIVLLESLQMIGRYMGYPLYRIGGQMLKASH